MRHGEKSRISRSLLRGAGIDDPAELEQKTDARICPRATYKSHFGPSSPNRRRLPVSSLAAHVEDRRTGGQFMPAKQDSRSLYRCRGCGNGRNAQPRPAFSANLLLWPWPIYAWCQNSYLDSVQRGPQISSQPGSQSARLHVERRIEQTNLARA